MELLDKTIEIFGMEHPTTIKVAQLLEEGNYGLALDTFLEAKTPEEEDEED